MYWRGGVILWIKGEDGALLTQRNQCTAIKRSRNAARNVNNNNGNGEGPPEGWETQSTAAPSEMKPTRPTMGTFARTTNTTGPPKSAPVATATSVVVLTNPPRGPSMRGSCEGVGGRLGMRRLLSDQNTQKSTYPNRRNTWPWTSGSII